MDAVAFAEVQRISRENRLLAADLLESLTPERWATPSLCAGWTVREVAAHLVDVLLTDFRLHAMVRQVLRYRGDVDRMLDARARERALRPTEEIVGLLREHAGTELDPPIIGCRGPLTDSAVHLRDIARPLGSPVGPSPEAWRPVLDFVTQDAPGGFVPRKRHRGLRYRATDLDWSAGEGAEVVGTSEALALAITARPAALADLTGPGVAALAQRIG